MIDPAINVRRLTSDDVARLRDVLGLFSRAFEDPANYDRHPPDDRYLRERLTDPAFIVLAAETGANVVGALAAYVLHKFEQQRSEVYIYDLAVDEPMRRRGVATQLIEALKPVARANGAWVMFVQADTGDDPAISLYESLGRREDVLHFDISPE